MRSQPGFQSYQTENTFTEGNGIPGERVVYLVGQKTRAGLRPRVCSRFSTPPGRGSSVPSRTRVGKEPSSELDDVHSQSEHTHEKLLKKTRRSVDKLA